MSLRVLIVPDKFKGTLTARRAAEAIALGWSQARPGDALELLPMADGGDGFGEVLGHLLGAERRICDTVDSARRLRAAEWWLQRSTATAIIETAQVNGLALLPTGQFHPDVLDTFGIGAVFQQAASEGARRLFVGIGGSATNDGGFGMARALGWSFWDVQGQEIQTWTELAKLTRVEPPLQALSFDQLTIAVDVANPLLGSYGASRIYGPQKGLRESDFPKAEACLARMAEVMTQFHGEDFSVLPGAGAAGGLGFGLKVFCQGAFQSGGEIFSQLAGLEERIQHADLIITGEGAMDTQTLMGKGVGVIAEAAARAGKPCLCLAGSITAEVTEVPWPKFKSYAIVPEIALLDEAKSNAFICLQRMAAWAGREHG